MSISIGCDSRVSERLRSSGGCSFQGRFMGFKHGEVSLEARLLLWVPFLVGNNPKEGEEAGEGLRFRDGTRFDILKGAIKGLHQTRLE
jgi:hypothetical protein